MNSNDNKNINLNLHRLLNSMKLKDNKKKKMHKLNQTFNIYLAKQMNKASFNIDSKNDEFINEIFKIKTTTESRVSNQKNVIRKGIEKKYKNASNIVEKQVNKINVLIDKQEAKFDERFSKLSEINNNKLAKIENDIVLYNIDLNQMNLTNFEKKQSIIEKQERLIAKLKIDFNNKKLKLDTEFKDSNKYDYDEIKAKNVKKIQDLRKNYTFFETLLLEKKKTLNNDLQKLVSNTSETLNNDCLKVNTQIEYLTNLRDTEQTNYNEDNNYILEKFKNDLVIVNNEIENIKLSSKEDKERKIEILHYKMQELDINKDYDLKMLNANFHYRNQVLNNEIKVANGKLELINKTSELNYNEAFNALRTNIQIDEEQIKYKTNHLNSEIEQSNLEFRENFDTLKKIDDSFSLIHTYRINSLEELRKLKENQLITNSTLAIEKLDKLRQYNIDLSTLNKKKTELLLKFHNNQKDYVFNQLQNENNFNRNKLKYNFQVAIENRNIQKQLLRIEYDYLLNKQIVKLNTYNDITINEILKARFTTLNELYNSQLTKLSSLITLFRTYYKKSNKIMFFKKNNLIATHNYIFSLIYKNSITIINLIRDYAINSIEFEKKISYEVELENLNKELNEKTRTFFNSKKTILETIENYENTIKKFRKIRYDKKKEYEQIQADLVMNQYSKTIQYSSKKRLLLKDVCNELKKEERYYLSLIKKNKISIEELNSVLSKHEFDYSKSKAILKNKIEDIELFYKDISKDYIKLIKEIDLYKNNINTVSNNSDNKVSYLKIIYEYNKNLNRFKKYFKSQFVYEKEKQLRNKTNLIYKLEAKSLRNISTVFTKNTQALKNDHLVKLKELDNKQKNNFQNYTKYKIESKSNYEHTVEKLQKESVFNKEEIVLRNKFFNDIECISDNLALCKKIQERKSNEEITLTNVKIQKVNSKINELQNNLKEKLFAINKVDSLITNKYRKDEKIAIKKINKQKLLHKQKFKLARVNNLNEFSSLIKNANLNNKNLYESKKQELRKIDTTKKRNILLINKVLKKKLKRE